MAQLTESTSIALAQSIERIPITIPLSEQPVATTYVHQGSGGTPIFLLHGFDSSVLEFRRPGVRERISRTAYYDQNLATLDAQLCAALHLKVSGWHQALKAFTKSGGYSSFTEKLSQISQPTLILWGECDRILGTGDAYKFKEAIVITAKDWILLS